MRAVDNIIGARQPQELVPHVPRARRMQTDLGLVVQVERVPHPLRALPSRYKEEERDKSLEAITASFDVIRVPYVLDNGVNVGSVLSQLKPHLAVLLPDFVEVRRCLS